MDPNFERFFTAVGTVESVLILLFLPIHFIASKKVRVGKILFWCLFRDDLYDHPEWFPGICIATGAVLLAFFTVWLIFLKKWLEKRKQRSINKTAIDKQTL